MTTRHERFTKHMSEVEKAGKSSLRPFERIQQGQVEGVTRLIRAVLTEDELTLLEESLKPKESTRK